MRKRPKVNKAAVYSDAELLGGVPVFRGTRVFFQTLIDYLETGHPLSGFLSDFPKVTRKQGLAALDQAKEALLASTRVLDDGCGNCAGASSDRSLTVAARNGRLHLQPVAEPATVRERSTDELGANLQPRLE